MKISLVEVAFEGAPPNLLIPLGQFETNCMLLSYKGDGAILNREPYVKAKPNVLMARYDSGVINFDLQLLGRV